MVLVAYIGDDRVDRGVKQALWRWVFPVFVLGRKLDCSDVPKDRGHGDRAIAPRLTAEIVVEDIVFYIFVARVTLAGSQQYVLIEGYTGLGQKLTVSERPPERCSATALAIEGFSATQRILILELKRRWVVFNICRTMAACSRVGEKRQTSLVIDENAASMVVQR